MTFTIRRATPADYDDVRRITRDAYLHAGYFDAADHPYVQVLADVEHRAEHAQVWVAEDDGVVVGSFAVTFEGQRYTDIAIAGELEFRMLAVDPAAQRGGYGRRMVEWIIEYARSLEGIEAVSLTSGTDMVRAHRLYESLGFQRVPSRDWLVPGEDIELWVFRLPLHQSSTVPGHA
ncbi:GNAT family N-acetyltransferase [Arthrobacter sp. JZ12]|uniref:GNAT family N-acetyltransferase n=1 Tax=Arthrobacter sp. JZ12 TaxID=2654190 RepID=UPI002B497822|nr:GNAT family N-acetyltransferase [Arthrobacter sp. JZ12]WRH24530.1 GNAT family N-acetyltransferase [Arthrobacter sp. JZ12]